MIDRTLFKDAHNTFLVGSKLIPSIHAYFIVPVLVLLHFLVMFISTWSWTSSV